MTPEDRLSELGLELPDANSPVGSYSMARRHGSDLFASGHGAFRAGVPLWKHDARVFTVDQGPVLQDDPDDPMRTAMRQMAGVFAQLERAMLVKRLRDARKHKAARGGHAVGSSPFGYRPGDWDIEEDPTEQEVLREIARLHAEGSNPSDIARRLNDLGLRSKRGGRWHPTSVRRIVGPMVSDTEKEDVKLAG